VAFIVDFSWATVDVLRFVMTYLTLILQRGTPLSVMTFLPGSTLPVDLDTTRLSVGQHQGHGHSAFRPHFPLEPLHLHDVELSARPALSTHFTFFTYGFPGRYAFSFHLQLHLQLPSITLLSLLHTRSWILFIVLLVIDALFIILVAA